MRTKAYVTASATIFLIVSVVHLLRLMEGWPVSVGSLNVPMWVSVLAVLASAGAGVWGLTLLRRHP
jgi:hypothetical protein